MSQQLSDDMRTVPASSGPRRAEYLLTFVMRGHLDAILRRGVFMYVRSATSRYAFWSSRSAPLGRLSGRSHSSFAGYMVIHL